MKFATWAVHVVSIVPLSVSPAEAQNALRGLFDVATDGRSSFTATDRKKRKDHNDRKDRYDRPISELRKGALPPKRDFFEHLGGPRGELSNTGETDVIIEVEDGGPGSVRAKCARLAKENGGSMKQSFIKLKSCVLRLPNGKVPDFGKRREVKSMEVDKVVNIYTEALPPNEPWGLDRIDQCHLPMGGDYQPMNAAGTKVYILDTGIHADHERLEVDADCSIDTSGDGGTGMTDGNGHGTHVAGTTCGEGVGVAKNCKLCGVQVLTSSGSGSNSRVIAGINYVIENCQDGEKCVANMSLGGGFSQQLNAAVENAVNNGITMVVAAGNSNNDACNSSPASEPKAITVGSTKYNDAASWFSNYGSCVDVFAPGSFIYSTWNDGELNSISGTSMASPHVAGLAAGILGEYGISDPEDVFAKIVDMVKFVDSTHGNEDQLRLVTNVGGCQGPTPPPTPCLGKTVEVEISTDQYGFETSWQLVNECEGGVWSGEDYSSNTEYKVTKCFPTSKFTFTIEDSYGDGICCANGNGYYKVSVDGVVKAQGAEFGSSNSTFIDGDCSPPTPPPVAPTPPPVAPTPAPMDTPQPTYADDSSQPTYFTCRQWNEEECTSDKGCQWTGGCHNCGCQPCLDWWHNCAGEGNESLETKGGY